MRALTNLFRNPFTTQPKDLPGTGKRSRLQSGARLGRMALGLALVFACTLSTLSAVATAQDGSNAQNGFKADTPKLDPSAEQKPAPMSKPLQAGIEHNEKYQAPQAPPLRSGVSGNGSKGFLGRYHDRAGAKNDNGNVLKGKTDKSNSGNFNLNANSSFGIIGVKFVLALGRPPVINRVFPGTPAYDKGLQNEDTIVAVDGVPTTGLTKEEVYDLIIGSPGTPVSLSIMRSGDYQVVNCIRMDINNLTDPVVRRDYMMSM